MHPIAVSERRTTGSDQPEQFDMSSLFCAGSYPAWFELATFSTFFLGVGSPSLTGLICYTRLISGVWIWLLTVDFFQTWTLTSISLQLAELSQLWGGSQILTGLRVFANLTDLSVIDTATETVLHDSAETAVIPHSYNNWLGSPTTAVQFSGTFSTTFVAVDHRQSYSGSQCETQHTILEPWFLLQLWRHSSTLQDHPQVRPLYNPLLRLLQQHWWGLLEAKAYTVSCA